MHFSLPFCMHNCFTPAQTSSHLSAAVVMQKHVWRKLGIGIKTFYISNPFTRPLCFAFYFFASPFCVKHTVQRECFTKQQNVARVALFTTGTRDGVLWGDSHTVKTFDKPVLSKIFGLSFHSELQVFPHHAENCAFDIIYRIKSRHLYEPKSLECRQNEVGPQSRRYSHVYVKRTSEEADFPGIKSLETTVFFLSLLYEQGFTFTWHCRN